MVEHLIMSFIASAAFGIIFIAPAKTLFKCGFVGMVGWMVYIGITHYTMDSIFASVIASFTVAIISQTFAKVFKTPVIIFNVSGIIPLVPGGKAYDAMRQVVEGDFNAAIPLSAEVVLISGSIAIGLVLSEVINQIIRKGSLRKSI